MKKTEVTESVEIEKTSIVEIPRPIFNAGGKLNALTGLNISVVNTLSKGIMAYTSSMKPAIM